MLSKEIINGLADRLKIDASKLENAISSKEEVKEFEIPEGTFFTDDELKGYQKKTYDSGKLAAIEMPLKDFKEAFPELKAKNWKDLYSEINENFSNKLKLEIETVKAEVGKGEGVKIQERDKKILELQTNIDKIEAEKNFAIETSKNEVLNFKREQVYLTALKNLQVKVPESIKALGQVEMDKYIEKENNKNLLLIKNTYTVKFDEEGKTIFSKDGQDLIDKKSNPVPLNEIISTFAKENYINIADEKKPEGRGKDDNPAFDNLRNIKSTDEFNSYIKEKGISPNTAESDLAFKEWKRQTS